MSLSSVGSGLLDTHVDWIDVQNELQKALETNSTFGSEKTVERIGEGNGFLSRMGLIRPDWQGIDAKELPQQFVVKILSSLSLQEFSSSIDGMSSYESSSFHDILVSHLPMFHNAEVAVYGLIEKYGEDRIPVPKIFCSILHSESSNGFIVMEYLENLEPVNVINTFGLDEVRQALRTVAKLQAISLKLTEEERKLLPKDIFSTVAKPLFGGSNENFLLDLESVGDGCFVDLVDEFKTFSRTLLSDEHMLSLDKWNEQQGLPDVIVHGDLWVANTLWVNENENLKLRAVVDYQTASLGCTASDLCCLLTNLRGDVRRDNTEQLIKEFYGYLEEELGGEVPFSMEKLRSSFDRFFPISAYEVFECAVAFIDVAKKQNTEKEVELVKSQLHMLMEDMILYHKMTINS